MGLEVDEREFDTEMLDVIDKWTDWNEFKIKPWKVSDEPEGVIIYWKHALRYMDSLLHQADRNLRSKNSRSGRQSFNIEDD